MASKQALVTSSLVSSCHLSVRAGEINVVIQQLFEREVGRHYLLDDIYGCALEESFWRLHGIASGAESPEP